MPRGERGAAAGPVAASVATALAVLAVLAVLASATVAGVTYRAEDAPAAGPGDGPSGASTSSSPEESESAADDPSPFRDGQVLSGDRRDNAELAIPSRKAGWRTDGLVLGYESEDGETFVGTQDPFVYDRGFCTEPSGFEAYRGYVGLTAPISETTGDDPARDAAEQTVERWLPVLFPEEDDRPDIEYVDTETADGTPAVSVTFDFEVTEDRTRCSAPAAEIRFLTFDTGDFVAVVVSQRDTQLGGGDLSDGLAGEVLDKVFASARVVPSS